MKGRNIAFDTPEPANGTVLVVYENSHGEENCPRVVWRDDERADRFRHRDFPADNRWFKNDNCYDPCSWGEVLAYVTAVHQVKAGIWRLREGLK